MEATTKDFRSRIFATSTRYLLLGVKRNNHSRTDSCRYTGHSPKTAKISSALPSHDQHVTALSVLIPKLEHHGKMNFSIWKNSIRNYVLSSDPSRFLLQSLSSLCVICTTFLHAKGVHVCRKWTICDKLLPVNAEEEKQCLSQEPAHIRNSSPCTLGESQALPQGPDSAFRTSTLKHFLPLAPTTWSNPTDFSNSVLSINRFSTIQQYRGG